jgi:Dihydrofolate reductase
MPEIVIIAALTRESRVIGNDGKLPWDIPEDLKRFQRLTTGHTVVMGRRTFESICRQVGGPLPDRDTVVLTTTKDYPQYPEVQVCRSVQDAMQTISQKRKAFICGGASVYEDFLPKADRLELTVVEKDYNGDTYFPPFEDRLEEELEVTSREERDGFSFVTCQRAQAENNSDI